MSTKSVFRAGALALAAGFCASASIAQPAAGGAGASAPKAPGAAASIAAATQPVKTPELVSQFPHPQRMPDLAVGAPKRVNGLVEATVFNRGDGEAGARTQATAYYIVPGRPAVTETASISALAPGAEMRLQFKRSALGAVQVLVDSGRVLAESDESNNLSTIVGAEPPRRAAAIRQHTPETLRAVAAGYGALRPLDGAPRAVAAAQTPEGVVMAFAENELTLSKATPAQAEAMAKRLNGRILKRIDGGPRAKWGPVYLIRVDTARLAEAGLTARERSVVFSSDSARNLLSLAKVENALGAKVGVNLLVKSSGFKEGVTVEALGRSALDEAYMRKGGAYDVDVATAWRMLERAGKTKSKWVKLGVLDGGFGIGRPDFAEVDIDIVGSKDASSWNKNDCGPGNPCPWHGVGSAEAAAGKADDQRGAAGPGGPVASILAYDMGDGDAAGTLDELKKLNEALPHIVNMSFSGEAVRDDSFFEGAWSNIVEAFEEFTVEMAQSGNRLLFASAGNDGKNIDQVNGDGDEMIWHWPCENAGVICVGGWWDDSQGADEKRWGKEPAMESNRSLGPKGETVDIYGPWCVWVGDNPDNPGPDVLRPSCGTSLASPFVAGVASLIWAANPSLSAAQVWGIMNKWAIADGEIRRVHAREAVREAIKTSGTTYWPEVEFAAPLNGLVFSPAGTIYLAAKAFDIEDGDACCAVRWTIDGKIVAETSTKQPPPVLSIKTLGLKEGEHKVVVTARDSDGAEVGLAATITVKNAPPSLAVTRLNGSQNETLFVGVPYRFASSLKDDSMPFGPDSAACKSVKWADSLGAMSMTHVAGCAARVTFSTPGPRNLKALYTDEFGASASSEKAVFVKAISGADLGVSLELVDGATVFSAEDWVTVELTVLNAQAPQTINWVLTEAAVAKTFTPVSLGQNRYRFRLVDVRPDLKFSSGAHSFVLGVGVKTSSGQAAFAYVDIGQTAFIK